MKPSAYQAMRGQKVVKALLRFEKRSFNRRKVFWSFVSFSPFHRPHGSKEVSNL